MLKPGKNVLKQALDLSPVATAIVDRRGSRPVIAYVNQAFEALSGYDSGELAGRSWNDMLDDTSTGEAGDAIVQLRCHGRRGVADRLTLDLTPLYEGPGAPRYWLATEQQADYDERNTDPERQTLLGVLREARSCLRRTDNRDLVTGALNRRIFDELLLRDWLLARREQRAVALLLFRVDCFAAYSEVYGRHAADACLRKVAHAITGSLRRASDLTARYGEDRFAVLIGEADTTHAAKLAERIAGRVRGLAIHHPRALQERFVTVSWGVASRIPASRDHKPDLIAMAEAGLDNTIAPVTRLQAG